MTNKNKAFLFLLPLIFAAAVSGFAQEQHDPQLVELVEQGADLLDEGKLDEAGDFFVNLIAAYPKSRLPELGILKVAALYQQQEDLEKAVGWLNQALQAAEEKSGLHLSISTLYFRNQENDKALHHVREAVNDGFESPDILAPALSIYAELKIFNDESLQVAEQLAKLEEPSIDSFLFRGLWMVNNNRPPEAVVFYRKAIRHNTNNIQARLLLGNAYVILEKYDLAEREYIKIINSAPYIPAGYLAMAELYEKTGEAERAKEYRQIVERLREAQAQAEAQQQQTPAE